MSTMLHNGKIVEALNWEQAERDEIEYDGKPYSFRYFVFSTKIEPWREASEMHPLLAVQDAILRSYHGSSNFSPGDLERDLVYNPIELSYGSIAGGAITITGSPPRGTMLITENCFDRSLAFTGSGSRRFRLTEKHREGIKEFSGKFLRSGDHSWERFAGELLLFRRFGAKAIVVRGNPGDHPGTYMSGKMALLANKVIREDAYCPDFEDQWQEAWRNYMELPE